MNRIKLRSTFVATLLAVVWIGSGCQERSTKIEQSPTRANIAKPGPEESFEFIVETFRRGVEEIPIGFVLQDSAGHSRMTGKNEVSYELIPPAKNGESYKGIITVASTSHYSIQRSTEDNDEAKRDERSDSQNAVGFTDSEEESGVEILDPELIGTSGTRGQNLRAEPAAPDKTRQTVSRKKDQQKRTYELDYTDGKWRLVTKLDPETEQSIQNAFDRALATQI